MRCRQRSRIGWFLRSGAITLAGLLFGLSMGSFFAGFSSYAQGPAQLLQDQAIYLPLIPAYENVAVPSGTTIIGAKVYGLLGTLERPTGWRYTYYLSTANNGYFALAGQTPQLEREIGALARSGVKPSVKVWGEVQAAEEADEPPLIVVTGIIDAETAAPTPTASPPVVTPPAGVSVPVAVVKFQVVNLYGGPASSTAVVGQVVQRQACEVTGRNSASTWLQLTCPDGQQGWVDARLVEVQGSLASVIVINATVATPTPSTPTPSTVAATVTPTPTPMSFSGWRTELFDNMRLSGTPVAVVDVPNVNFNWGSSGPSQVSADGFSLRFTRRISVSPAYYQFTAVADDGIRVWVDGKLIINAWPANPGQSYVVGQVLTGEHDLQVEYYEQSGLANVRLEYIPVSATTSWQASYYYGVTPSGNPAFTQQEARGQNPLQYNWSTDSPTSTALGSNVLGYDYWSVRWEGEFPFDSGNYIFRADVDDGIRLYLDGLLVLNYWRDGYKEVSNRVIGVGAGYHTVVVEYYERTGNASIDVWWYRDSAYTGPQ